MQRTKGAVGEREAAAALSAQGIGVSRLARNGVDGAADLGGDGVVVEVKRRRRLAQLTRWMSQAQDACDTTHQLGIVMMREDDGEWIVCVRLDDIGLLASTLSAHRCALMSQ